MKFSTHAVATLATFLLVAEASAAAGVTDAEQSPSYSYVEQLQDLSETAALLSSGGSNSGGGIPFFAFCGAPSSGGRTGTAVSSTSVVEGCLAMDERIHETLGHEFYGDAVLGNVQNQPAQHWQYHNGFLKTTGIFDFRQQEQQGSAGSNSWSAQVQEYCLGLVDTKITAAAASDEHEEHDKMYAVRLVECPPEAETLEEQASTNNLNGQRHLQWLYKPQTGQIESLVEVVEEGDDSEDLRYCLTWSTTGQGQEVNEATAATTVVLQKCAAPTPAATTDDKHQRQKFVAVGNAEPFVLPLVEGGSESATIEVAYFTGIDDSEPIDMQTSNMSLEVVLEDVTNTFSQEEEEEEDSVVLKETLDGLDHAGILTVVDGGDIVTQDTVMTVSMNLKTSDEGDIHEGGDELPSSSNTHVVFISTFDIQQGNENSNNQKGGYYSCSVTGTGLLIAFGAVAGLAFLAVLVNMTFCRSKKTSSSDAAVTPTSANTKPPAANGVDDDDDDGTVRSVSEASDDIDDENSMVGV
eukprot:CAMPEP_0113458712 /NCGR_PEP_ID=MMETSP0014_2-20120614/10065_1 /TAXON_ID=2857 /ORGANISM="Nitzschia sp." /LENGTH=522 /DNA_ID=CAMNT_0000350247 /DNA_START=171 /DNA_END=1739 /DNA_ORIENTATION=+ /assembly_acc=CAM_ASM_000159